MFFVFSTINVTRHPKDTKDHSIYYTPESCPACYRRRRYRVQLQVSSYTVNHAILKCPSRQNISGNSLPRKICPVETNDKSLLRKVLPKMEWQGIGKSHMNSISLPIGLTNRVLPAMLVCEHWEYDFHFPKHW